MRYLIPTMEKGITDTPLPARYNPEFIFPDKRSPYHEVLKTRVRELMTGGAAGTGKTHTNVMKGHKLACNYPGSVGVFCRKVKETIKRTIVPTFYDVLGYDPMEDKNQFVKGIGGSRPEEFRYNNGSLIYCVGLNDPKQLDSLQIDWCFLNQAEETEEDDWQLLVTRNRGNSMPYRIVFGDCNPSFPTHYLCPYPENENRRKRVHYIATSHEDNPAYYLDGEWTKLGRDYVLGDLESLTGLRYDRYRLGLWRAPEGAVFTIDKCHILSRLPWDRETEDPHYEPISNYEMYRAMDFGMYPSPSTCLWLAEHKQTKDTIVVREWRRLNVDTIKMAAEVKRYDFDVPVVMTTIDNDKNIQQILWKHGIETNLATKGPDSIKAGLDIIESKLDLSRKGLQGGLYFYTNIEAGRDAVLEIEKRSTSTIDELRMLAWDTDRERTVGEDHGIDPLRYHFLWKNSSVSMDELFEKTILKPLSHFGGLAP